MKNMDSKCVFSICTIFFSFLLNHGHAQNITVSVANPKFGGVPDGKTDNSNAFLSAWKAACGTPGGTLLVPNGTFVVSGATFQGPCKGQTNFQNQGTVRATPGAHPDLWIMFYQIDGLRIFGQGTFDGNGASAWSLGNGNRPTSIKLAKVTKLKIEGVTSLNSKMFHFHIYMCTDVLVNNVKTLAPADSPNTDGIHVARSKGVRILSSVFSTGDDCISIGDGSEDIRIESIKCGPGHGISIGSLGNYNDETDVRGITVVNCDLTNTANGLRIKTRAPSLKSTTVSNVTFQNIKVNNVQNPIIINQYYCPNSGTCSHSTNSGIKIDGVKYINITGTSSTPVAVNLQCSKSVPCQNLLFQGLGLTTGNGGPTSANCSYAKCTFLAGNQNPRSCGNAPLPHAEDIYAV